MANIVTLDHLRTQDEKNRETEATVSLIPSQVGINENGRGRGRSGSTSSSAPIKFLELLFPYFTFKSLILYISIADWVIYIVSICIDPLYPLIPSVWTLVMLGANCPYMIHNGEVWRLITAAFLHANFIHIFFNVFFQLRMGFTIERRYGLVKFAILYFIAAVYGNLLSATSIRRSSYMVGASTAGFGMIGVQIAELGLAWHRLQHKDRILINISIFFLLMILFMFTFNGKSIDQLGHLGGFIFGLCCGVILNNDLTDKPNWYSFAKWISVGAIIGLPVTCTLVILLVD